jgi:D-threo-aldose 1-dehydrogenase
MPETSGFSVAKERAHETLKAAFESPVNFLDTTASYGDGETERRIGEVLNELGGMPSVYVISTKADRDLSTADFSGEQMRRSVERSLRRLLGMDRLPLVYLHDPEHASYEEIMSPGGAVEVLANLKQEGVIEHLGVTGGPVDLMIRYVETGTFEAAITHNRYTLINRTAEPLLERAAQLSVPALNAAPYGGILAKGPDAYARYAYQEAPDELVETVRKMSKVCREHGVPLAAAALQFSTKDPRVVSTMVGLSRPERVEQTLELAAHPVPDELWPRLEALVPEEQHDPEVSRWT